ncbi:hypothetical protein, conserved [Eimeria tenella]|uniref:Uncharacterized protein n=1 Tax=Eimeria tenella TaxID=5802 RepID=U6KV45_EIMTE|nr:hypothetical protein, conserved [Eimeria tenella]CDJ40234.1 hypothetical protein, conserved [Eimeria tenella]|eukprot:XP_013230987.1 hypothetical protein, conserved [Eimeria tenella]
MRAAAELVACAAAVHVVALRCLLEAYVHLTDVHSLATQHFGAWQRLCCCLGYAQKGLVASLRLAWEASFCRSMVPFILHRTLPCDAAAAAAAAPQQQQQQQQQARALDGLWALEPPGGPRVRFEKLQQLLQLLQTTTDTQQLAEEWRSSLSFLDCRLPDVLDYKL